MPDDPFIEEMDEFTWVWMYQNWLQDQEELHKTYKNYALFIGSFFNWEMANALSKQDNPDYEVSDEEFEQAYERVRQFSEQEEAQQQIAQTVHRRHKRVVK